MRLAARWLLILALSLSVGLQWALVQSAAWVGMVVANTRGATVMESIIMTFDGRHECRVCKALDRNEEMPKKQSPEREAKVFPMAAPEAENFVFELRAPQYGACRISWPGKMALPPPLRPPERV